MSTLEDLPREIISLVCSLLEQPEKYQCVLTNKKLYSASLSELWRAPSIPTQSAFHQLVKCLNSKNQRGEYIRALKLNYDVSLRDRDLLSLLPFIPNLEILELRQAEHLTDKGLIPISRHCPLLKQVGITGSPASYRSVHYLGQCAQLTRLTLASCPNLTSMALLPFAHSSLLELDLSGCKWLTTADTAFDLQSFVHLTHLNLVCCNPISADFLKLLDSLTELQDFSITGNNRMDDDDIIPFLKAHPGLRGLFLMECDISDAALVSMADCLPQLDHLDVSFCTHITVGGIRRLIRDCPRLKLLGIKQCGILPTDFSEISFDTDSSTLHNDQLNEIRQQEITVQESYAYIHHYLSEQAQS